MQSAYIARAVKEADGTFRTQPLAEHLAHVAEKAGEFAAVFGNRDWGEMMGYWHDLGKYHPVWQRYIRDSTGYACDAFEDAKGKIYHTRAGAVYSMLRLKNHPTANILAYIIAGHHTGLPDWYPETNGDLLHRLYKGNELDQSDLEEIQKIPEVRTFMNLPLPRTTPMGLPAERVMLYKEQFHLWIRMLFSCLVDADFLDAERFEDPAKAEKRGQHASLEELKERFDAFIFEKENSAADIPLNHRRKVLRMQCVKKASLPPGFFSLVVPTGGGKTLSSMAFALEHALHHKKRRIIYAIPYTSIIEQTAKIFKYGTDINSEIESRKKAGKELFGENQVIEHHSQVRIDDDDSPQKLASDNWDAPIIVTTNVQLFESLFAARTVSCRKLHNIAGSVIILDEVQMLPPEFLEPILSVLRGLVECFQVTVVLMTATLPTLEGRIGRPPHDFDGLQNVLPIIDDYSKMDTEFHRVNISFPSDLNTPSSWEEIRDELIRYEQVLCIVNSRKDCRDLYALMPPGTLHLSALMCPAERSYLIGKIKESLNAGEPLRVVSTQLVEAGVDIDFPVVYRALAGFDSIAQAAGRCNRENRLAEFGRKGTMVVFVPPKPAPAGLLRKGEDACKEVLRTCVVEQLAPSLYKTYFSLFYAKLNTIDKPNFHARLVKEAGEFRFQFRSLSRDFQLIDDRYMDSLIVRYNVPAGKAVENSADLIRLVRSIGLNRDLLRRLQRFMVNIPTAWMKHYINFDMIETIHGLWVQRENVDLYLPGLGLVMEDRLFDEQLYL